MAEDINRARLEQMKEYAWKAFERALERGKTGSYDQKAAAEKHALEAISAYAAADTALSLDRP